MDYVKLFAKAAMQRSSETDGLHEIHQKGICINVRSSGGGYRISMNRKNGKSVYRSLEEAKEKIFKVIESGAAERYLNKDKMWK